jgi:hypothetical protein
MGLGDIVVPRLQDMMGYPTHGPRVGLVEDKGVVALVSRPVTLKLLDRATGLGDLVRGQGVLDPGVFDRLIDRDTPALLGILQAQGSPVDGDLGRALIAVAAPSTGLVRDEVHLGSGARRGLQVLVAHARVPGGRGAEGTGPDTGEGGMLAPVRGAVRLVGVPVQGLLRARVLQDGVPKLFVIIRSQVEPLRDDVKEAHYLLWA